MDNWMEKFERYSDEKREKELNYKLNKLLEEADENYKNKNILKTLEEIIKAYEDLRREAFDYDEKDYAFRKKQLEQVKNEILKKEYDESVESQSWNEYKEKEQEEMEDEER